MLLMPRKNRGPRLPGTRFETQSPPLTEALPRMDIAVFVGFAASGPVDQPVAVVDSAQFALIFGEDAPLVSDGEHGDTVRAYLGPSVRAFFRNGGKRCWVIRVARGAQSNRFPLPALLARQEDGTLVPAFAEARSEGNWSDSIRASAALQARSLEVTGMALGELDFELAPSSPGDVEQGDLLRFNFRDEGYVLYLTVNDLSTGQRTSATSSSPISAQSMRRARRATLKVKGGAPLWCRTRWLNGSRFNPVQASARVINGDPEGPAMDVPEWSFSDIDEVRIRLEETLDRAPGLGERVSVDFGDAQLMLTVQTRASLQPERESSPARGAAAGPAPLPPGPTTWITGINLLWLLPTPAQVLSFPSPEQARALMVSGRPSVENGVVTLELSLSLSRAPAPGSVLRVDFGSEQLWLTVQDISAEISQDGATPVETVRVRGRGHWMLTDAPAVLPQSLPEGERLSFDLLVRQSSADPVRLAELGFAPSHARYWGAWPVDARRFLDSNTAPFLQQDALPDSAMAEFFPLAGLVQKSALGSGQHPSSANQTYIPLAMPLIGGNYLEAVASSDDALKRDGLDHFDAGLFLDAKLLETNAESLMGEADFLRYQSPSPVHLKGIHAALSIEEATLIAVPDAVHPGWTRKPSDLPPPAPSAHTSHPEWWRFLDCQKPQAIPEAGEPSWGEFIDCDTRVVPAPQWRMEPPAPSSTVALKWSQVPGASYVLEEATEANWNGAAPVYRGAENRALLYGRSGDVYYYRVRAEVGKATSDWSDGLTVRLDSSGLWQVRDAKDYEAGVLLSVQRALLRMCAARGDLLAVLTLPEHYREDDAITHAESLRPLTQKSPGGETIAEAGSGGVFPLAKGEEWALSYGALYHPWVIGQRVSARSALERIPPDGVACGVLAERALTRGAWIAPANELLRGVVALKPVLARTRWLELQEARVNLLRQEPRGFVVLCADTLSLEPDLRPINVRRLMILLRRLASRLGAAYVFEPNDDSFRRGVQRGFEAMLDYMFARGAFAGRTAATSYQVVTDNTLNTRQSVEEGRFIVELKVAPSLPLSFLTVRLVQTNDRSFVTEVR
jgi:hypothetical protein